MTPLTLTPTATTAVETFFAAWNAADLESLQELADRNVVINDIAGLLYTHDVYVGHAGLAEAVRELETRWDRVEMRVVDTEVDNDGTVLAVLNVAFTKHAMSFDADIPVICELQDGLVVAVADGSAYVD